MNIFSKLAGSVGFEPTTYSISLEGFDEYLRQRVNKRDVHYLNRLSKEYGKILQTRDARELLTLSPSKRKHCMLALTHLAEFNGCKRLFKEIKENYGLKWHDKEEYKFDIFEKANINEMLNYIQKIIGILPKSYASTVLYDCLTGLRIGEACKSIHYIQNDLSNYLNRKTMILEHYKYNETFLRKSKNAYISIVTPEIIEIAKNASPNYEAIKSALRRSNIPIKIKFARKIYATWLRDKGIPSEIIDLLQGRSSLSIFTRHYYRPDFNEYTSKIRNLLVELRNQL